MVPLSTPSVERPPTCRWPSPGGFQGLPRGPPHARRGCREGDIRPTSAPNAKKKQKSRFVRSPPPPSLPQSFSTRQRDGVQVQREAGVPPEEARATACVHKRRSAQQRTKKTAGQWPKGPWVPFCWGNSQSPCNTAALQGSIPPRSASTAPQPILLLLGPLHRRTTTCKAFSHGGGRVAPRLRQEGSMPRVARNGTSQIGVRLVHCG